MIDYYNKKYHAKYVLMSTSIVIGQKIVLKGEKVTTKTLDKILEKFEIDKDKLDINDMIIYIYSESIKRVALAKNKDVDVHTIDDLIGKLILATS